MRESALFVFQRESWFAHFLSRDMDFLWRLKWVIQNHQKQVSQCLHDRKTTTDLSTNFLQESDKLVYGSLDLLAPEWTVVKRALCRWCCHWFPSHASSRTCCRWKTPGWKFQWSLGRGSRRRFWAHNLWEECCRPKCLTPHSRKRTGYFSPNRPTWKMKKIRGMKRKMRETVKSAKWRVEENQDAQAHETWMTRCALHLEPVSRAADKCEKMRRVRVFCSHTTSVAVDCHQLKTILLHIFLKKKSSTNFHSTAAMRYWEKKTNATFGLDKKELVQVSLLQIRGGDGAYLWLLLGSLIGVSSVHFCLICSVRCTIFSKISSTPQRMGKRSGFPVLICPSRCTSPRSSHFWAANHDFLDLVGSDREFHQISFWDISSAHCGPRNVLSVPQFCRAEHHEVANSWWRSSGLRKHPVVIGENVGWIRFLSRDVHKCNRRFLVSNKEIILSIALLELFRMTRTALHCPFHESLLSTRHWMGCRRYFVANRLWRACRWGWPSIFFTSSRTRKFSASTHKSPRSCLICVYVFFVFLQTFNKQIGILAVKRETCIDFLSTRTGRLFCHNRSPCSNNWIFGLWTIGWECIVKDDGVRSRLIEL